MPKILSRAGLCLVGLLAGCSGGGGGGGGVASTPPPPGAQRNATLTSLQYSEAFGGTAAEINYSVSRSSGAATRRGQVSTSSTDGAIVRYDAAARAYTVSGASVLPATTFGPANQVAGSSNNVITIYQKTSGSREDTLALFNPGAANSQLALTYASYGAFQGITDGVGVDVDTTFFTYGVKTAAADMPRSGTASYTTKIDGQFGDPTGVYALGGSSSFTADFAAATVAFSMTPIGQNVVSGQIKQFATHTINGRIESAPAGQKFSGSTHDSAGYSSDVLGYFYGPAAAEIAGTFTLVGNQGFGVGALVGKKN